MAIELLQETPNNQFALKFLYQSLKRGYETKYLEKEVPSFARHPSEAKQPTSTMVLWHGKILYFDLCDDYLLWNKEALKNCDLYFKVALNWGFASIALGKEMLGKYNSKIAPFLTFTPDLTTLIKRRKLYKWVSKLTPNYRVCQIQKLFSGDVVAIEFTNGNADIPSPQSPEHFHAFIRLLTKDLLSSSEICSFIRLEGDSAHTSESDNDIHPPMNRHWQLLKIISSDFLFLNVLPQGIPTCSVSEGLGFDRPLILDHNLISEQMEGFEIVENDHYISLLGEIFTPESDESIGEKTESIPAKTLSGTFVREKFSELETKVNDEKLYQHLKANVMAYRNEKLTAENLCNSLEKYLQRLNG